MAVMVTTISGGWVRRKACVVPTGKTVKSSSTFELNAKFSKGKRIETVIWSIKDTDYISFGRNRDMSLVQGPVHCLR